MITTLSPEYIAAQDNFINYLLTNAPKGVYIKATKRAENIIINIMNAPAELYNFAGYGAKVHYTQYPNNNAKDATPESIKLWGQLNDIVKNWLEERPVGAVRSLKTQLFIGAPRRSFVPIAKDTPEPKVKKSKAAAQGIVIPKAEQGSENAKIAAAMWQECEKIISNLYELTDNNNQRDIATILEDYQAGLLKYKGDNNIRDFHFCGYTVKCTPVKLINVTINFCKMFGYKYPKSVNIAAYQVEQPAPEQEPAPAPASEPKSVYDIVEEVIELEDKKAAENKATEQVTPAVKIVRKNKNIGQVLAAFVIALLRLVIALLSVTINIIKLAECGKLRAVAKAKAKAAIVGNYTKVRSAVAGVYLRMYVYMCVSWSKVRNNIKGKYNNTKAAIVSTCEQVRSKINGYIAGVCASVTVKAEQVKTNANKAIIVTCERAQGVRNKAAYNLRKITYKINLLADNINGYATELENL